MRIGKRSLAMYMMALLLSIILVSVSGSKEVFAASVVFSGDDGWYFITSDSTIPDYQGTNLYTPLQLDIILQDFLDMRDKLAEGGKEFVVFLAPNKEHIYNEYMPSTYGELAPITRIEQLYEILKDNGVRVIYPEVILREAKEKYQYDLYYKTDPHWNEIGTYICSKLLLEELGTEMPDLETLDITPYAADDLDCSKMLGVRIPDLGYTITGYESILPSDKRIFLCGDSFGAEISDCITPIVADCFLVHRDIYQSYMPYLTGSTVVVYEILERFLDTLPEFFERALS